MLFNKCRNALCYSKSECANYKIILIDSRQNAVLHLIGGIPGHCASIGHTSGDNRLGAGDEPGVIEYQDDGVILRVGESVAQKLAGALVLVQKHPALGLRLLLRSFYK